MKTKEEGFIQQGDVIIETFCAVPDDAKKVGASPRGYVLAEGSATGHAHVLRGAPGSNGSKDVKIGFFQKGTYLFITNKKPVYVTHEEHKPVTVPAGTWRVRVVQEYDHFAEEARAVQD